MFVAYLVEENVEENVYCGKENSHENRMCYNM